MGATSKYIIHRFCSWMTGCQHLRKISGLFWFDWQYTVTTLSQTNSCCAMTKCHWTALIMQRCRPQTGQVYYTGSADAFKNGKTLIPRTHKMLKGCKPWSKTSPSFGLPCSIHTPGILQMAQWPDSGQSHLSVIFSSAVQRNLGRGWRRYMRKPASSSSVADDVDHRVT